jgi:hypothetical protein
MKRAILISYILFFNATAWAQFEHPLLKAGKKRVSRIIMMPVNVNVMKVGVKGGIELSSESREMEKALALLIAGMMRDFGCSVNDASFASNPDLGYLADDLQKMYGSILGYMDRKPKDVRKGRFSMGDMVAKLPAAGDADALLFVQAGGKTLTGGKKAFNIIGFLPFPVFLPFDIFTIRISLVDAATGDILYYARSTVRKNIVGNADRAKSSIQKSLRNFTKANQRQSAGLQ